MISGMLLAAVSLFGQQMQLPPPSNPAEKNLEVRYAQAQLQLAEANLGRVEQSNKEVERTIPSSIVAEYQDDVRVAKARLEKATAGEPANGFQAWLARAEAERRAADTTWKNATTVNQRAPGTFAPIDVERFRLRAEVAKLQLERGQSLANAERESQLQWQSDLLDNQVQRLKDEMRDSAQYNGLFPRWWW